MSSKMSMLLSLVILPQFFVPCLSSGWVEILLVNFTNKEGKRVDGQCCDPVDSFWSWSWRWFTEEEETCKDCNHVFSFCLGSNAESSSMMSCEFGRTRTSQITKNDIKFGSSIGGIENPFRFNFTTWPGMAKIKLDILDEDKANSFDFIDHFDYQYSPSDIRRHAETPVKMLHLVGSRTEISFELRVYCDLYYFGSDCSEHCHDGDDEHGHYKCNPFTGVKICLPGWAGVECTTNLDDCIGNRCSEGSTCIDDVGYYTCKCPPGRVGVYCAGEINECTSNPCQNQGTCTDHSFGFTCKCHEDWTGVLCETKFIQCVEDLCVHGFCTMKYGKDMCICNDGYFGELCDKAVTKCEDKPCVHMQGCENHPEGYKCLCKDGYTGKNCETKIKPCDSEPCQHSGDCKNLGDSYYCLCQDGYFGGRCEFKTNECESNPCRNNGICLDLHLGYRCHCINNTTGRICEEFIDKCHTMPCQNGGTCISESNGYRCMCPEDTDGPNCEIFLKIDPCDSFPCQNEATCIPTERESFTCQCAPGYTGKVCETEEDICESLICQNGGTCKPDSSSCTCVEGYTGSYCEDDIDDCENDPCENGGLCIDKLNDFECNCLHRFTGQLCEEMLELSTSFENIPTERVEISQNYTSSSLTREEASPTVSASDKESFLSSFSVIQDEGSSSILEDGQTMTDDISQMASGSTQGQIVLNDTTQATFIANVFESTDIDKGIESKDLANIPKSTTLSTDFDIISNNVTKSDFTLFTSLPETVDHVLEKINDSSITTEKVNSTTVTLKPSSSKLGTFSEIGKTLETLASGDDGREDIMSGEEVKHMDNIEDTRQISGEGGDVGPLFDKGEQSELSGEGEITKSVEDALPSTLSAQSIVTSDKDEMYRTKPEVTVLANDTRLSSVEGDINRTDAETVSTDETIPAAVTILPSSDRELQSEREQLSGDSNVSFSGEGDVHGEESVRIDGDGIELSGEADVEKFDKDHFKNLSSGSEELSGEEDLIKHDGQEPSGEDLVKSDDGEDPSGEDLVKPDDGEDQSGEDLVKPDDGEDPFGEDLVKPDDGEDHSGEDLVKPDDGEDPSGEDLVKPDDGENQSGEDLVKPDDGEDQSGEDLVKPDDGEDQSDEDLVKPDDGKDPSGEDLVKPDDGENQSGEDLVKPDDGEDQSGEDLVKPDDGEDQSGEYLVKPDDGEDLVKPDDGEDQSGEYLVKPDDGEDQSGEYLVKPDDGEDLVKPDDGEDQSGEDLVKPDDGEDQSGEDLVKPDDGEDPSGEDLVKPDDGEDQSGEDLVKPDDGEDQSGEDLVKPDDGEDPFGEDLVKPDDGEDHSGEDLVKPDDGEDPSGEDLVKPDDGEDPSGEDLVKPDGGEDQSGEDLVKPDDGEDQSGEDLVKPDDGKDPSGEDLVKPDDGENQSGEDLVKPDDGEDQSGEDLVKPDDGEDQSGEYLVKPDDGEDLVKPDDGEDQSGEYLVKPDDGEDPSGEDLVKPDDGEDQSGEDLVKPDDGEDQSGEDLVKPDDGEDLVKPDDGEDQSGEDLVKPDDGEDQSGEDLVKPDNGEDLVKPDDGEDQSGEDLVKPDDGEDPSGEDLVKPDDGENQSGEDLVKPDDGEDQSGEDLVKPDDGEDQSGKDLVKPDGGEDQSGDDLLKPDDGEDPSGKDLVKPDDGEDQSDEDLVKPDDGQEPSGKDLVKLGDNKEPPYEDLIKSGDGEDPSDEDLVKTSDGKEPSDEDFVKSGDGEEPSDEDLVKSGDGKEPSGEEKYICEEKDTEIYSDEEDVRISLDKTTTSSDWGAAETVSYGIVILTSDETIQTSSDDVQMVNVATELRNLTVEGTTESFSSGIIKSFSSEKELDIVTRGNITQVDEGETTSWIKDEDEVHSTSEQIRSTSHEGEVRTSETSTGRLSEEPSDTTEMTTVSDDMLVHESTKESDGKNLCGRDANGYGTSEDEESGGIISILSRIQNLLSRRGKDCRTTDVTSSSPDTSSVGGAYPFSSTETTQTDRLSSTFPSAVSSVVMRSDHGTSAIALPVTTNGVHLRDKDYIKSTAAIDKIIADKIEEVATGDKKLTSPEVKAFHVTSTVSMVSNQLTSDYKIEEVTTVDKTLTSPEVKATTPMASAFSMISDELTSTTDVHSLDTGVQSAWGSDDVSTVTESQGTTAKTHSSSVFSLLGLNIILETYRVETATLRSLTEKSSEKTTKMLPTLSVTKGESEKETTYQVTDVTTVPKTRLETSTVTTPSDEGLPQLLGEHSTESPGPVSTSLEALITLLHDSLSTAVSKEMPHDFKSTAISDILDLSKENHTSVTDETRPEEVTLTTVAESSEDCNIFSKVSTIVYNTVSMILEDDSTADYNVQKSTASDHITLGGTTNGIHLVTPGGPPYEATTQKGGNVFIQYSSSESKLGNVDSGITTQSGDLASPHEVKSSTLSSQRKTKKAPVYRGPRPKWVILHSNRMTTSSKTRPPFNHESVNESQDDFITSYADAAGKTTPLYSKYKTRSPGISNNDEIKVYPQGGVAQTSTKDQDRVVKLTVYKVVKDVLMVSNQTAIETYNRARETLRKRLEQLADLWRQYVRGVVEVVYVPAVRGFFDYTTHLNSAYTHIRKAYEYGSNVLRRSYNNVSEQLTSYFNGLIDYFQTSYNYYYDLFQASRRRRR